MPPRKTSTRRKKSSPATATAPVDDHDLSTPEVETGAESADVVKIEKETETEILSQVQVSNPAEIRGDSTKRVEFFSESVDKEEVVVEYCAVVNVDEASNEDGERNVGSDKVKEDLRLASEDVDEGKQGVGVGTNEDGGVCVEIDESVESEHKENQDLGQGSVNGVGTKEDGGVCVGNGEPDESIHKENVDEEKQGVGVGKDEEGVVSIDGSQLETVAEITFEQEETAAVKVADLKILDGNNTPLVVKRDGDEDGKEIAEVISAQESNVGKAPYKNDDALIVEDGGNGDKKGTAEIVATQESAHTVSTKAPCENSTALAVEDDSKESGDDEESDGDSEGDDADNEGDDNKKDKDIEIYVGRLDKNTVEDDLINVFQKFGELKSARIVRNSTTNKSKGFGFLRFASVDQAKRALSELKDGVEVKGKLVKISTSQYNDTLYLGNICKTWKQEEVLQQLKDYGIEHIKTIRLPEDPKNDEKIKGFAFLEFSTHSEAVAAFQRLRKPDAAFGRDVSAKVAFAQNPMHPSDEDLSQVKRVYVEGLPKAWTEEKLKEICEKYGEIANINLCQTSRTKHKDFGFVTFTSHESALACVDGINNADVGGEVKIKASIAKPQQKSRHQRQGFRGGFKVEEKSEASSLNKKGENSKGTSEPKSSKMKGGLNSRAKKNKNDFSKPKIKANTAKPQQKGSKKQASGGELKNEKTPLKKDGEISKEAESSKMKSDLNSQKAKRKRKPSSEQNVNAPPDLKHGDRGNPKKPKNRGEGQNSKTAGSRKRKNASKYEDREAGGNRKALGKKPFKKQKGNMHGRERDHSRNPKGDTHNGKGHHAYRDSTRYADPHPPNYAASGAYHRGPDSMSTRRHMEMAPHAGYIEPASVKHSRPYSGYVQPVARTHSQYQTAYLEPAPTSQSQLHSRYLDRPVVTQSHRGYIETAVGPEVQPYRGYRQSAIVQIAHDSYDPGFSRTVRHDGRGTGVLTYAGGAPLPASQARNHTSYYQGGGSYSGAYGSQRTYY